MSSNKILVLDTILRNPKLKRQLEEAYGAPIGSTKRQSMKDTVSSIKKIGDRKFNNNVQDGQGGPGPSSTGLDQRYSSYTDLLSNPYNQTTSVNVPKAAPSNALSKKPQSQFSSDVNAVKTGAQSQFTEDASGLINSGSGAFEGAYNAGKLLIGGAEAAVEGAAKHVGNYFFGDKDKDITMAKDTWGGRMISDVNNFYPTNLPKTNTASAVNVANQVKAKTNGTIVTENGKAVAVSADGKTKTIIKDPTELAAYVFKKGYADTRTSTGTTAKTNKNTPVPPGGNVTQGPAMPDGSMVANKNPQAELNGEQLAIDAGPLATYMNAMSSEKNRRQYFPGQTESFYKNGSGNLSAMLGDIKSNLKTEYQIDRLEDQYNQTLLSQQNIVPDLTDYVKHRDTAIKDLDGLIDKAESQSARSTDAVHMAAHDDYIKNLYTLRNRQTVKYTTMINRAQQVADKNLTRITNEINQANADMRDRLATETAITTEQYNNMKALIAEKWTMADQLDANRVAKKELAAKELALDDAIVARSLGLTTDGTGDNLLTIAQAESYQNRNLDKDNNFLPGMNISNIIAEYATMKNDKDGSPVDPQYPIQSIRKGISTGLNAQIKDANGDIVTDDSTSLKNLQEYLQQFNANKAKFDGLSPTTGTDQNQGIFREQIASVIVAGAQKLIDKYTPSNIEALKTATVALKNVNVNDENSLAAWKRANSSVPSAILDGLAQAKADNKASFNDYFGLNKTGGFIGVGGSDSFDKVIADRIMYGIKALTSR